MRLFVASLAFVVLFIGAKAGTQISCASSGDNGYQECEVEDGAKLVKSIKLVKELPGSVNCIQDQTYYIGHDDRSIVVTNGCSAVFAYKAETPKYNNSCYGNGYKLYQFNGKRKEDLSLPCKYHAVRQTCGPYYFRVTPGNIYLYPTNRLDTIWLGIHKDNGDSWEGRTTNKIAVKFFNGYSKELFNKKEGNLETKDLLVFGKDGRCTWVEDVHRQFFRLEFCPWDPDSSVFKLSSFKFVCTAPDFQPVPYLDQICGGWRRTEVKDRKTELGLQDRQQAIFYDVLRREDTVQTDAACIAAEEIFNNNCTEEQRITALKICAEIVTDSRNRKCVTKYSCQPMDPLVDCLRWVCGDFKNETACYNVAAAIDMCPPFNQGNLTALVNQAKCNLDFISIVEKKIVIKIE